MEVGDRVIVKEKRATVRFLGQIEGHPGQWVGIDYDDPTAGKHDGLLDGKRFFQARYPKSGSFVKRQLVDTGSNLLEAVRDRYTDSVTKNFHEEDMFLSSTKQIEFVGMEKTQQKQSEIDHLTTIVLDSRNVSRPPPPGTRKFCRCKELNLYNNLLHLWQDVEECLKFFPALEELVLRKNRMDFAQKDEGTPWDCSPSLQDLILSDCEVSSESISYALTCISSVVNLYALRNQIGRFDVASEPAARLRTLDLEGNPLERFSNVVGSFPNLTKLSLVSCGLTDIDLTADGRFPKLEHLNLLGNEITQWQSVQKLRHFPKLATLFIKSGNLRSEKDITACEVITALLPTLKDINRFDIKATERRSAEIRFINKYSGLSPEKVTVFEHDLTRLIEAWGPPVTEVVKKGVSMVKLRISGTSKTLEKSLPLEITVQRLTEMLCRLFSMNSLQTRVYLEKTVPSCYRIELDNPARSLDHYSPEPTDTLLLLPV